MRGTKKQAIKAQVKSTPEYKAFLKELASLAEAKLESLVAEHLAKQPPARPTIKRSKKKFSVVLMEWDESERGWGIRPDGASLHLTKADCDAYVKEYWDSMPDEAPDEYSRPAGSPTLIDVDANLHAQIKKSKNGIRLWQNDYSKIRNNNTSTWKSIP